MIYLATPYSDPDPKVQERRYDDAVNAAAILANHRIPCYCPIVSWHVVALRHNLPGDHEFWLAQDHHMIRKCNELWVLMMSGWSTSKGIKAELNMARDVTCIEIIYIPPFELSDACDRYVKENLVPRERG